MEFKVLTEEAFRDFIKDNPKVSFMQTPELAHLKKELGSGIHYLGVTEGDKTVAASLVLEDSTILNKKMFYAP
ncbi:MAG: aminoacyltransferase, partial [Clostridiales bacterium]|nr:aminoacyltransferase [Clostridiales bacterium]